MEFVLRKAKYASSNDLLRRNILEIAQKCEEVADENGFFLDFIDELEQLEFLKKEEQVQENEIKILEEVFKSNLRQFLICHHLWQKFGPESKFFEDSTQKYAIIFELNKTKSFIKEIEKLMFLQAKVTVISKTYM